MTTTAGNSLNSDGNSPKVDVKKRNRRSSSLKLPNGLRLNLGPTENKVALLSRNEEARIEIREEQQPLVGPTAKGRQKATPGEGFTAVSPLLGEEVESYIDDYITPAMNYKESCRKSPPIINTHDSGGGWDKQESDNISLYGTPKEEMIPGLGENNVRGPSFMRSQIEALFQPSGKEKEASVETEEVSTVLVCSFH